MFFAHTQHSYRDLTNRPFRQHQGSLTFSQYSRFALRLVSFLMRANELSTPIPLTPELQKLLRDDIPIHSGPTSNSTPRERHSVVRSLFLALWTACWTPTNENLFPDPTIRFILHTQVNLDGSLKPPENVTGVFAKLEYILVST